jgi:hypothetical protein
MTTKYQTKYGSESFARKLQDLVRRGRVSRARYLLCEREGRCGRSNWNPAYGILVEGGARCVFTGEPVGE